jgi:hypothetical protein
MGEIPTTDNIPETTEKLGFPTDNIPGNRFYKTLNLPIPIPEDIQLLMYECRRRK